MNELNLMAFEDEKKPQTKAKQEIKATKFNHFKRVVLFFLCCRNFGKEQTRTPDIWNFEANKERRVKELTKQWQYNDVLKKDNQKNGLLCV